MSYHAEGVDIPLGRDSIRLALWRHVQGGAYHPLCVIRYGVIYLVLNANQSEIANLRLASLVH